MTDIQLKQIEQARIELGASCDSAYDDYKKACEGEPSREQRLEIFRKECAEKKAALDQFKARVNTILRLSV
jgi:hypothetical protein